MTGKELFEEVTKLVSESYSDKVRAAKILMTIYLSLCKNLTIDDEHSAIVFKDDLDVLVDFIPFDVMEEIKK